MWQENKNCLTTFVADIVRGLRGKTFITEIVYFFDCRIDAKLHKRLLNRAKKSGLLITFNGRTAACRIPKTFEYFTEWRPSLAIQVLSISELKRHLKKVTIRGNCLFSKKSLKISIEPNKASLENVADTIRLDVGRYLSQFNFKVKIRGIVDG